MGTLYVVGAPVGDANDLTRRAARILREVAFIVTADEERAQRLLVQHNIATPLISAGSTAALAALERGDLALLIPGWSPALGDSGSQLVVLTIERGFPVLSIPGPSLPLTALVISGLPADSFVHLGELPQRQVVRSELLAFLAAERRTLVVTTLPQHLPDTLQNLYNALGQRPVVAVSTSEGRTGVVWRGTLGESPVGTQFPNAGTGEPSPTKGQLAQSPDPTLGQRSSGFLVLVIGGAREQAVHWEEGRLRAEVQALRQQGLSASQIGRQLATKSGWPRRDIYRLAAKTPHPDADMGWDSPAEAE